MVILQFIAAILVAYLVGAFPTGVIVTKLIGAPDVRYHGSGNTGGTNTAQIAGPKLGAFVVIVDGLKALIAWAAVYVILLGSGWALPIAGTFAVIGHCWPIYTRFHGGMGLATGGGLIFIVTPVTLLYIIPVWAIFYYLIFKKTYSPRSVSLAILIGPAIQLVTYPLTWPIQWLLLGMIPVLFIRHLPEWNRQV